MIEEWNHALPGVAGEAEGVEEREAGGEGITDRDDGKIGISAARNAVGERERAKKHKGLLRPANP